MVMAKFRKGDKVRVVKPYGKFELGEVGIIDENDSGVPYAIWECKNNRDYIGEAYLELIYRPETGLKKIMNALYDKFKELNLSEPERTFRKASVTDANGDLTEEGRKVFDAYLLNKYGMEFKTDVVDKILVEEAKKKDKK